MRQDKSLFWSAILCLMVIPAMPVLAGINIVPCTGEPLMIYGASGQPATVTIDYLFESLTSVEDLTLITSFDSLAEVFGVHGTDWTFTSIFSPSPGFANPSFDGHSDLNLIPLLPSQTLPSLSTRSITVELQLLTLAAADPDGNFCNSVMVFGTSGIVGRVGDASTAGTDPDPNGDDAPEERAPSCFNVTQVPVELTGFSIDQ